MNLKRIWVMFMARNYEFFRDRAAFGWNFAFPFLIIVGFGIIFGGKEHQQYKVGVFPETAATVSFDNSTIPQSFVTDAHFQFIGFNTFEEGEKKLRHHKIDLLIDRNSASHGYWVNDSSSTGYLAEQLFLLSFVPNKQMAAEKRIIQGEQIRYIDWFFPGMLAMNMMFSALWGVGYVVVRYRKNGTLKRLKATPLTPLEYLCAQMLSRIFLLMFTLGVVWTGADLIFHFKQHGSFFTLALIFFLGGMSLCSIGLVLAARGTSEEFTSGVLNFITWPMMFLSEVWFSLEGSPGWVQKLSLLFPLTHLLTAARKVINEGATLWEVQMECWILVIFSLVLLSLAAKLFSWNE